MNSLQKIVSNCSLMLLLVTAGAYGQKQTKTYKESFKVGKDAVIDLNTSYADIEFETWEKDEVSVEAVVELEGASEEEAKEYFEEDAVEIKGNSREIEISTGRRNSWAFRSDLNDLKLDNFVVEIPEIRNLEPLFLDLEIPDLQEFPELLELPPIPHTRFDYEAYKKDGEAYMKKWQKEFSERYDEEYKERMQEWADRMQERAEEWQKRQEELQKAREESLEKRKEAMEKRKELKEKALEERERAREHMARAREEANKIRSRIVISGDRDDAPNFFYHWRDGAERKYKVKKTIKIKMPKSAKLKMNVRHGEVKLAENARNIDATLSYARLLASSISGDETSIIASYSPVFVQKWDFGKLKADFSDEVNLKEVKDLVLYSNSSEVKIEKLLKSAMIRNNLGVLRINSVADNFKDMDIAVQYGELFCELPSGAYTIHVDGTASKLSSPSYLVLDQTKNYKNTVHRGYHLDRNSPKTIVIRSEYSDVVLDD